MSHLLSEDIVKQKLRRLEEINDYNKAKIMLDKNKKQFMSHKDYERFKKILFETDYKRERLSLSNPIHPENLRNSSNLVSQSVQTEFQTTKKPRQLSGNIVRQQQQTRNFRKLSPNQNTNTLNKQNTENVKDRAKEQQQQYQTSKLQTPIESKQQNSAQQQYSLKQPQQQQQEQQSQIQYQQKPPLKQQKQQKKQPLQQQQQQYQQQQKQPHQQQQQQSYKQQLDEEEQFQQFKQFQQLQQQQQQRNEAQQYQSNGQQQQQDEHQYQQFREWQLQQLQNQQQQYVRREDEQLQSNGSTHLRTAQFQSNGIYPEYEFQQTLNYEEEEFEKQQFQRNIRLIEMEKREIENELDELKIKAHIINSPEIPLSQTQKRTLLKKDPQLKTIQDPRRASMEFKESLSSSKSLHDLKMNITTSVCTKDTRNSYSTMQRDIGLDFESEWNRLEKHQPITKSSTLLLPKEEIGAFDWLMEDSVSNQQQLNKPNQLKQCPILLPSKVIKSFLPDENWETNFNKIGKSQEERQIVVDNQLNFFQDFLQKSPKRLIPSQEKYIVNKTTIDRLSEDIELLMRQTKFQRSPSNSFHQIRNLFAIPEEQGSYDNSLVSDGFLQSHPYRK